MKIHNIGWLLLLLWSMFACEKGKKTQISQAGADSIRVQLQTLNDSMNKTWQEMTASDDLKFRSFKRLLQEISYMNTYNESLHDSLVKEQESLTALRYKSPQSLTSSQIDTYDAASDAFKKRVLRLSNSTPGYNECSLCRELWQDIENADNATLINRINYDRHATQYNNFIRTYGQELAELNADYKNLSPRPLFQIPL